MLNHSLANPVARPHWGQMLPGGAESPEFLAGQPALVATEFSYGRNESIYGEGEPAEYVYQVICGAVRSYKLLCDGRRQIGAFHLPGDLFGLESGSTPPPDGGSDRRHVPAYGEASRFGGGGQVRCPDRLHALDDDRRRAAPCGGPHVAARPQDRRPAGRHVPAGNGSSDLDGAGMFALPMGRGDIADYLGLTLETVSRTLSQLHGEGVLGFSGARQITLRNRPRLAAMDA